MFFSLRNFMTTLFARHNKVTLSGILPELTLRVLVFLCLFFAHLSSLSAATALHESPRLLHLNTADGLNQNTVYDLLIDRHGFLYVATEEGLNRFDGHNVISIEGKNREFANNPVYVLFEDSRGKLWISTGLSGVYQFDLTSREYKQVFAGKYLNDPNWHQYAESIIEDDDGNIIIAANHQVIRYDYDSDSTEVLYELSETQINDLQNIRVAHKSGNVLLVGTDKGLYSKNLQNQEVIKIDFIEAVNGISNSVNNNDVKKLKLFKNGNLWIGTVEGLYQTSLSSLKQHILNDWSMPKVSVVDKTNNIWSIESVDDETIYIGTDKGLYLSNVDASTFTLLLEPQKNLEEISYKGVYTIENDRDGNIWFGTKFNGAMFWSPTSTDFFEISNLTSTPDSKKLSSNIVWSVHQQKEGELWVGTENGLNKVNLSTGQIQQFMKSNEILPTYTQAHIRQIVSVSDTEFWLLTGDGLRTFDTQDNTIGFFGEEGSETEALFKTFSWSIVMEGKDTVWSLQESELVKFNLRDESSETYTIDKPGFSHSNLHSIIGFDIRTSNLLLADSGRLLGFNTKTQELNVLHSIVHDGATLDMVPSDWLRDTKNNFWLAYAGRGLFQLDGNTFDQLADLNKNNFLPTNLVYDLTLDYQDNLWFSSHSGLHELNTDTMLVFSYQYIHGVSSTEFNSDAHAVLLDGRLAYGSTKGVTLFSPVEVSLNNVVEQNEPVITEVSLLSGSLDLPFDALNDMKIEMEHDDLGLSVGFSSLNYRAVETERYNYRLISNDKVINFPATVKNKVEISSLPPGEHVLEIFKQQGLNSPTSPARLYINVKYAPLLSPIAIGLYVVLLFSALLIFIIRRNHTQRVLAKANQQIGLYNKRLTSALKASNSDIWEWSSQTKRMTTTRLCNDLGYSDESNHVEFEKHLGLIHEVDRLQYLSAWRQFIRGEEEQFDNTYRMLHSNGEYLWFRDAGSISSGDDEDIFVTGTYTNVTESMASKERLKLFGDAFKHTRDWVIILDKNKLPLGANPSFCKAFSINENIEFTKQFRTVYNKLGSVKQHFLSQLSNLKPGERWKSEIELSLSDKQVTTITDVNAIADENDERLIEYYLVIMTDITEQKEAQKSLQRLANYDVLTGLINRTMLIERLKTSILYARRHSTSLAVVFIDLDRFKPINDTFGHEAGDIVIVENGKRIQKQIRENDAVSRLGGDEFVVVLEEVHGIADVNRLIGNILEVIEQPIYLGAQSVSVSASAGIAMYPDDAMDAESLLRNADVAMYSAKESGKNRFQHFTSAMNDRVQQDMLMQNKLKVAVGRNEFENYYQPIIDVKTKRTAGFEMLMRWNTNNQFISPGVFIPIAEQIGLIVDMTMQAIERGLSDVASWYAKGFEGYMAINLSAKHFSSRPDFERILDLLAEHKLPPSCLRFEITEGLLVDDNNNTLDYMYEMRELGFKISLDDFGTGYSSLRYLKDFPIDVLKIDKSFVDDIDVDTGTESIIESTLIMTKMLKMDTVAEGIETPNQVAYFSNTHCRYLQGYYFSRPVSNQSCYELLQKDWNLQFSEAKSQQDEASSN